MYNLGVSNRKNQFWYIMARWYFSNVIYFEFYSLIFNRMLPFITSPTWGFNFKSILGQRFFKIHYFSRFDILDSHVFSGHFGLCHLVDGWQNRRYLQVDDQEENHEPEILFPRRTITTFRPDLEIYLAL